MTTKQYLYLYTKHNEMLKVYYKSRKMTFVTMKNDISSSMIILLNALKNIGMCMATNKLHDI